MIKQTYLFLSHLWKARFPKHFRSREELEQWQNKMVNKHLQRILPFSQFYQSLFSGRSLAEWRSFPTIEKQDMMDHFTELNTLGITKDEAFANALEAEESRNFSPKLKGVTVGLSSGTSGNRGLFLVSDEEKASWAGYILGKALPGSLLAHHKVAFFLRANSNLYTTVNKGMIQFRFFDLQNDLDDNVKQLGEFKPTILVAPPSMLRFLATRVEQDSLHIHPQKIISVAEVLDPLDQEFISQAFKQTIHQVYQCTEGFLATTCIHGTLHINEDLLVIQKEYLDADQIRFSPIITDFSRITQPIIRYKLNDILVERQTPCPCGSIFTAIEAIEGRCDDLFYLPSSLHNGKLVPVFPDFIRRAIITSSPSINQYIVIQQSPHQMTIFLDASEDVEDHVRLSIESMCKQTGTIVPVIRFEEYRHLPNVSKLRRVERRFQVHETSVV